jgi:hypothetical protein
MGDELQAAYSAEYADAVRRAPALNYLGQPRRWEMPEEPGPEVKAVRDAEGGIWTRSGDRWAGGRWIRSWRILLDRAGPLTEVVEE